MTQPGAHVQVGAVQAAWGQVCALRSGDGPQAWPEEAERIAAATARYGAAELVRSTVALVGGALGTLHVKDVDESELRAFHESFVEALMNKLAAAGVASTDLPMVREVVTVALLDGGDPVAWRDQAGPIPESERRTWTVTLAVIADFVDRVEGPGACERGLLTALGDALDDPAEESPGES